MLIFECPYCGVLVDETDLAAGGEAHLKRYGPGSSDDDFESYLFNRENPKGWHREQWCHTAGCRRWFNAVRDTVTSRIKAYYQMGAIPPEEDVR